MFRVLAFILLIAAGSLGALWFADRPGDVVVNWQGYRIETSVAVALVLALVFGLATFVLLSLVRTVLRIPSIWALASRNRRRAKGYVAVSRGMVAVGAGDPSAARRYSAEAERFLGDAPLTLLLKAQTAQIRGDRAAAESAFKAMLDDHETRVLGLRGLYVEARRRGDETVADAYASEAVRLAPAASWASEAVFARQCATGQWAAARLTLDRRTALRLVAKDEARRGHAALLAAEALDMADEDPSTSLRLAQEALKFERDLAPAATLAGRLLARRGDLKKASKVMETAWRTAPQPDLAEAYIHLRGGDSALDRLARAKRLQRLNPASEESRLAVSAAALAAREFMAARETLRPLLDEAPTTRAYLLAAEIEEAEHGDTGAVREWLSRAARAPRDASWMADGVSSANWQAWSPNGRLAAYRWMRPPEQIGAAPLETDHGAALIDQGRGQIEDAPAREQQEPLPAAMPTTAGATWVSSPPADAASATATMALSGAQGAAAELSDPAEAGRPAGDATEAEPPSAAVAVQPPARAAASVLPLRPAEEPFKAPPAPDDPGPEPDDSDRAQPRWFQQAR